MSNQGPDSSVARIFYWIIILFLFTFWVQFIYSDLLLFVIRYEGVVSIFNLYENSRMSSPVEYWLAKFSAHACLFLALVHLALRSKRVVFMSLLAICLEIIALVLLSNSAGSALFPSSFWSVLYSGILAAYCFWVSHKGYLR